MENENHLDNQINLIFETHLVNQVNGEIIILFHSLSKKCGNENHLDNQIKGEMPPRGVEKGVSQESPHFSFPEATMVNIKKRVGQKPRHLLFPEVGRSSQEKLVIIWHTGQKYLA